MSFHVYIARSGFKDTPIPAEEWLSAARSNSRLSVTESQNRKGVKCYGITLTDTDEKLGLSPYGLVHAQDPSEDLVAAMFELAPHLRAGVYSERMKQYESVADRQRRSLKYRTARAARLSKAQKDRRLQRLLWGGVITISVLAGWYLAPYSAA